MQDKQIANRDGITLWLAGDVMSGRGIDQIQLRHCDPRLHEPWVRDARDYVRLAERVSGPVPAPVDPGYCWGAALAELDARRPDLRIINLETAITARGAPWPGKGIHYRMHPDNVGLLAAAGPDCCALANNHLLDWGREGLADTLAALGQAGIASVGAGPDAMTACAPAILPLPGGGRLLVFARATGDSGVMDGWSAAPDRSGIALLDALDEAAAQDFAAEVARWRRSGDLVLLSVHWGGNWGADIPQLQRRFARRLVELGAVDLVHGHSSHHARAPEVWRGKLIIYGCGACSWCGPMRMPGRACAPCCCMTPPSQGSSCSISRTAAGGWAGTTAQQSQCRANIMRMSEIHRPDIPPIPTASQPATSAGPLRPGVRKREAWAWAMYDFANSGYTTVVITAVFNAWFVSGIAGGAPWATFAWTAALSLSYALILLSAPLLGAWADTHAGKKRLLAWTTLGCVLGTAGLALSGPGSVALALAFVVLSNFCFGSGENLIAAFLPELAEPDSLAKVSGWGWGLGYVGGLVSLGACLGYITWARAQGQGAADFIPVCMLITAALFALASLPTFALLRERVTPQPVAAGSAWGRVLDTLRHARRYRDMRRFMLCIVFYQAGIQAVIALAAIYAEQAMGFSTADTIKLIFLVNITAALGALAFGRWQDRIGHVRAITLTLVGWIVMVLLAWSAQGAAPFWIAANIAGLCLGASQSAARALVGWLAPENRHGEFFGLWGLAVKLSSILGPLTYGAVNWLSGGDHRLAILATGSYFVIGLVLLAGVDAERGRRAALEG